MSKLSTKKLVIAQIVPSLESGGVERGAIDLAIYLKRHNHQPIIITSGGRMINQLKENNIKYIILNVKSKNPINIITNIIKLKQIIKYNKIDILHTRSRAPMISAYYASKIQKIKLVSTIHGTYSINIIKRLYNSYMLKAKYVIMVSSFIKNYVRSNYPKYFSKLNYNNSQIINRGVDINYFNIENIDKIRITNIIDQWQIANLETKLIFVPARFTSWKGHEFLIDALNNVSKNFLCIMAGSSHGHDQYLARLKNKVNNLELSSKIKFVDNCSDMPAAYAICDFVIAPSIKAEAFGRIPIEAQSCQKPIIASNIGGYLETIIDNKTGFIFDNNNINDLTLKITNLLNMPNYQLEFIGKAGRDNVVNNFSNDIMLKKTLNIYLSLTTL
jgi:glycosyltransferase involved in cell wall biosynthesis